MAASKKGGSSNSSFLAFIASIFGIVIGFLAIGYLKKEYDHLALLVLPGLVCGILTFPFMRVRNVFFGIWCFLISFTFGFFSSFQYFNKTKNLNQYIAEWQTIPLKQWGFIVLGALLAYLLSRGRSNNGGKNKGKSKPKKEKNSDD